MKKALYIVLIVFLSVYCGPKPQKVERYMEDGVEVVMNHLEPYKIKGEPSNLIIEEEFTIDTERDDLAEIGLTDIGDFEVDSEQNIYFINWKNFGNIIFKYDRNANFVTSFLRRGQGPGEIQNISYSIINKQDEIVIIDYISKKLLKFSKDGSVVEETRIDPNIFMIYPLENGNNLIGRTMRDSRSEKTCLCNSEFEELKQLDRKKPYIPLKGKIKAQRSVSIQTVSNGKIFIGNNDRGYEIWVFDLDGNLLRKIKKEYKPVEILEEVKKGYQKAYERPNLENIRKRIYFPKHMPPFQYFFNDDEGRLFVMTYEKGENAREFIYDIFNPDGIFIGRISLDNYGKVTKIIIKNLPATAKKNRLYCLREKDSGYKKLVVYKMKWE